ncbi:cyclic AMP-dependent transcription factor ATF-6 alpha-like [Ptychodera flava]|uniref:cyclic AMP-dependent transcription factor ATF-6 alpha-like n=1 Tax=Ptychodera flava TaxID=63121 RepID=UPI00396A9F3E
MSFDLELDTAIDIYTPCLIDSLDKCLEEDTLFTDDLDQLGKAATRQRSESSMSSNDSDPMLCDLSSDQGISPHHSLISEDDDIDLLKFLVKDNEIETFPSSDAVDVINPPAEITSSAGVKSKTDCHSDSSSLVQRNRKNAIAARENRQKKKRYLEGLESENCKLSAENRTLKSESGELKRRIESLEEEVMYLKSVLAHQSTLSKLLKNIGKTDLNLTTSFAVRDCSEPKAKRRRTVKKGTSGGVCLHVSEDTVSVEFCSECAGMAKDQDTL